MNESIQMFIGNQEVEFSVPLDILYNYPITELENPTVVKNSFSKTITIEGTPTNNQIFGHYWSVERLQVTSTEGNGIYFNASRKVPFVIYVDGVIYEQGYVKLDNVVNNDGIIHYQITLYGGLGDFFYCLKSTDDGEQKKLSDLDFGVDLDFTINAKTVFEAWQNLNDFEGWDEWMEWLYPEIERNEKWETINFMPAYNGMPDKLDSDKVILDTTDTTLSTYYTSGGTNYTSKDGYIMCNLPSEMTEWEIRDLRSYLQRPCIRMKKIIEACCKPENNGGYNVELDSDFFNENNSYWEKTWLTLPMIQSLEYKNETQILDNSKLISGNFTDDSSNESYMYQDLYFDVGNFNDQTTSSLNVRCNIRNNATPRPYTSFVNFSNNDYTKAYKGRIAYGSLFVQLLAFNGETVIGASQAYNLTSPIRVGGKLFYGANSDYEANHQFKPYMNQSIYTALGWFQGNRWCYENSTTPYEFNFYINNINSPITGLKLCYFWGSSTDKKKLVGVNKLFDKCYQVGKNYSIQPTTVEMRNLEFIYVSSSIKAILGESLGSTGTLVTKQLLLNTESSPCDYLLSYCKMFGLYFRKDVENNTIYIETRKTFFDRNNILDLSPYIDKNKELSIKPLSFDTKWYEFKQSMDKTDFYEKYYTSRGVDYGCKILNTGYEFIADKKNLLESNVIKSGIEGLEKSKYFTTYGVLDDDIRPWMNDGMTYELYSNNESIEVTGSTFIKGTIFGINDGEGMKYYDLFPKLQFHKGNGVTDGNNVLVFFSGFENVTNGRILPLHYNLSDDNKYQAIFNDGTPCWLFTKAEIIDSVRIAYKLDYIPKFGRYLTENKSNKVFKSLDFGTPQELYVPNYSLTDDVNIYSNFWKSYIEDLYDVNTRILTCYVKVQGRPNPEWLRRFYWFDNAIWRLNNIIDWNISSYDTTKMEFVKVHNVDDYTSITQTRGSVIKLYSNYYTVSSNGGELTLNVETESTSDVGNEWRILNPQNGNTNADENFVVLSRSNGIGNGEIGVTVSSNNTNDGRPIYLTAVNGEGVTTSITLYQQYNGETYFNIEPENMVIGAEADNYEVIFKWFNQYNYNVDTYIDEGDIDVLGVDFNSKNKGVISINSNNDNYVKSEIITFIGGNYEDTIGIDQLPSVLEFDKEGKTTFTLSFKYNKPNFTELPYWVNIVKVNDYEYKVMAKPNYYEEVQESVIKVNGIGIVVRQEKGDGINKSPASVTPTSFYYDLEGGTQFLMVNISNDWTITNENPWIVLSQRQGNGNSIVSVRATQNDYVSREGTITVKNLSDDETFEIYVSQVGITPTPTFTINPSTTTVSNQGGIVRATFTYKDKGTDFVIVNGNGLNVGNIVWNGENGYCDIIVPKNEKTIEKTYEVVFMNALGNFTFTIVQDSGDTYISVENISLIVGFEGGTITNIINSNTSWTVINDADWLTINPLSGEGNNVLTITASRNTTSNNRSSVVNLLTVDNKIITFTVYQRLFVPQLTVYPSSLTFDADGGEQTITISSNSNWIINAD